MEITFVLPSFPVRPVGGFLVVYRYASELVRHGHSVTIVHPRRQDPPTTLLGEVKAATWRTRKRLRWRGRPPWFELDERIRIVLVKDIREIHIPSGDAIFATACTTAPKVASYAADKGAKFYLIQHYEDFIMPREQLEATWKLPMQKVVSSRWLLDIGIRLGEADRLTHIPYGVELDLFRAIIPPEERSPFRVGMLAHHQPFKGLTYGIDALRRIRDTLPQLDAVAFGTQARPQELPTWISYIENPTRAELADFYNSLAVFMHTSVTEGWGLTGAEAMACGCALVAADSGGVRDYAFDRESAVVVPSRDPHALAASTNELIRSPSERLRIAKAGHELIQRFTWDRAGEKLETAIRDVLESRGNDERTAGDSADTA